MLILCFHSFCWDCFVTLFRKDGDSDSAYSLGDCFVAALLASPACRRHPVQVFCFSRVRKQASFLGSLQNPLRRDGDSNPGNPFGVYTLSRRASSTTRASLQPHILRGTIHNRLQRYCFFATYASVSAFFCKF